MAYEIFKILLNTDGDGTFVRDNGRRASFEMNGHLLIVTLHYGGHSGGMGAHAVN